MIRFLPLLPSRFLRAGALGLGVVGLLAFADPSRAAVALASIDDREGDRRAAAAVDEAVRAELAAAVEMIDPGRLRDAQRRGRIRSLDHASTAELQEIGRATGAEQIVTITVHQANRANLPSITLSGRAYSAISGELLWVGFESASGLDGRKLLGLGVVEELDVLATRASGRLVEDLLTSLDAARGESAGRDAVRRRIATALGRVAVLPLGAVVDRGATDAAETATEAVRAVLFRHGVDLVAPNRIADLLRRFRSGRWGGVEAEVRRELHGALEVRHLLTGSVERFDLGGAEREPEPKVAIGLRLLEAASGRIVWTGERERSGWDGQGPFGLGRSYTRGDLTERMVEDLMRDLRREWARRSASKRPAAATDSGRSAR